MSPSLFLLSRAGQRLAAKTTTPTTSASACPLVSAAATSLLLSPRSQACSAGQQQIRRYKQEVPAEGPPIPSPTAQRPDIPPYPLGPRQLYKQSNTGLYGNARIRFGNIVSRETEIINPQKNRRKWRPNIQEKRLFSESLGVPIRTRVNTRVLRTIDKVGGLDEYLLGSKPARIAELGPWGWRLRWRIMQTPTVQERFRREREALGLPTEGLAVEDAELESEWADAAEAGAAEGAEETQKMIDGVEVFDMAPQEDFMQEQQGPKTST